MKGLPLAKCPLARPRKRWEDLSEIVCRNGRWVELLQNRVQWRLRY